MNLAQLMEWANKNKALEYRKFPGEGMVFYRQAQSPGLEKHFSYMSVIEIGEDSYAFLVPAAWQFLGQIPERDKNTVLNPA